MQKHAFIKCNLAGQGSSLTTLKTWLWRDESRDLKSKWSVYYFVRGVKGESIKERLITYSLLLESREQIEFKTQQNQEELSCYFEQTPKSFLHSHGVRLRSWRGCKVRWTHFLNWCEVGCFDSSRPGRAMRGGLSSSLAVSFGRGTTAPQPAFLPACKLGAQLRAGREWRRKRWEMKEREYKTFHEDNKWYYIVL